MDESSKKIGANHHAGSQSDIPDIDDMINANPCAKFYMQLEECLVDSNRNWKICQPQVQALKECSTRPKGTATKK
jgi:cytochrome c oxidase assembly factor 4